jgi:multidrug efflux pump subunit AcrB
MGANVKVVEVPPGPPVLSPIVAEVYGPDAAGRRAVAQAGARHLRARFGGRDRRHLDRRGAAQLVLVDRRKAALLGVPQAAIVATLRAGLAGENATWLHGPASTPRRCAAAAAEQQGSWTRCCSCRCASAGSAGADRELVT